MNKPVSALSAEELRLYNPWRESLENCISGDNYLRASEYYDLIEYIDSLLADSPTAASVAKVPEGVLEDIDPSLSNRQYA